MSQLQRGPLRRILSFLYDDICSGDDKLFAFLMNLLALKVQNPGLRVEQALILHGPNGSGKNRLAENFGKLFAPHQVLVNSKTPDNRFNSMESQTLVVIWDESFWASATLDGVIKTLITAMTLNVEEKYKAVYTILNQRLHFILSNKINPLPVEKDSRRYTFIWVDAKHEPEYWKALQADFDKYLLLWGYWFHHHEVPEDFDPRQIFVTQSLVNAKVLQMQRDDPVWHWLYNCARRGNLGYYIDGGQDRHPEQRPPNTTNDPLAYEAQAREIPWPDEANPRKRNALYHIFIRDARLQHHITEDVFFKRISAIFGKQTRSDRARIASSQRVDFGGGAVERCWPYDEIIRFPPLVLARKALAAELQADSEDLDIWSDAPSRKRKRAGPQGGRDEESRRRGEEELLQTASSPPLSGHPSPFASESEASEEEGYFSDASV
jgi:hypothetical protein